MNAGWRAAVSVLMLVAAIICAVATFTQAPGMTPSTFLLRCLVVFALAAGSRLVWSTRNHL